MSTRTGAHRIMVQPMENSRYEIDCCTCNARGGHPCYWSQDITPPFLHVSIQSEVFFSSNKRDYAGQYRSPIEVWDLESKSGFCALSKTYCVSNTRSLESQAKGVSNLPSDVDRSWRSRDMNDGGGHSSITRTCGGRCHPCAGPWRGR